MRAAQARVDRWARGAALATAGVAAGAVALRLPIRLQLPPSLRREAVPLS